MDRMVGSLAVPLVLALACMPRSDLDAAARGSAGTGGAAATAGAGAGPTNGGSDEPSRAGRPSASSGAPASSGAADTPSSGGSGAPAGGAGQPAGLGGASDALDDLPDFLPDSPVQGEVTITGDAQWEVAGAMQPTFEIRTPTASYWLVKSLGMLVSVVDASGGDRSQWIDYNAFRPARGFPSFACAGVSPPTFSSELDESSRTPQHVRVQSDSLEGDFRLIWDIYLTHLTLSVVVAPTTFAACYRGVPAGSLDDSDWVITSAGREAAIDSWDADQDWVAFADTSVGRALYVVQHGGDELVDHYRVKDSDSAQLLFGRDAATFPRRFSLGLLLSAESADIESRVGYVRSVIP